MERRMHTLVCLVTLVLAPHALAQNPTISLIPLVDDVRRECVGGPNDGQTCSTAADCEVGPECQRLCVGGVADGSTCVDFFDCAECEFLCPSGPDAGLPCTSRFDCTSEECSCISGSCTMLCSCKFVIEAHPGDVVTSEVYARDWSPNGEKLAGCQVNINMRSLVDELRPLGFDRPDEVVFCDSAEDCPAEFPICPLSVFNCEGPNHTPSLGAFIDMTREDFAFFGIPEVHVIDTSNLLYRYAASLISSNNSVPFISPRYLGSLVIELLGDVGDRVSIPFGTSGSALLRTDALRIVPLDVEGLIIEIVEPPPPPETIPTTSGWGIVVLSLSLLAGAKVRFGRHATT